MADPKVGQKDKKGRYWTGSEWKTLDQIMKAQQTLPGKQGEKVSLPGVGEIQYTGPKYGWQTIATIQQRQGTTPKPKPSPDPAKPKPAPDKSKPTPPAAPPAAPPAPATPPAGRRTAPPASAPPAASPAPARRTPPAAAPQASPVAAYMKAAAAARKSGDPAEMARVRDMGLQIWRSAPANKKLVAAADERERTRGTSATTNPLMKDLKDRLPAPKPTQPETNAFTRSRQTAQAMGMSATTRNLAGPAAAPTAVPNLATTAPARAAAPAPTPKPGEFSASNITPGVGNNIGYDPNTKLKGLYKMSTTSKLNYTGAEKPLQLKKPVPLNQSYEYEPYDLVLEYLLSEGHADTVDEAHYVMMQMSAKHIQNIIEDVYMAPIKPETKPKPEGEKSEKGERRVPFAPGSSGDFGPQKPKVKPPARPSSETVKEPDITKYASGG